MTTMMRPMVVGTTPLGMKRPKLNLDISTNSSATTSLYAVNSTSVANHSRSASLSQLKSRSLSTLVIPTPISPSGAESSSTTYSTGTPITSSYNPRQLDTPISSIQDDQRSAYPPYIQPAHLKSILLNGPLTLPLISQSTVSDNPTTPPLVPDFRPQSSPPDFECGDPSNSDTLRRFSPKRVIFSPEPPFQIPVPNPLQDESNASTPCAEVDLTIPSSPAHISNKAHSGVRSPRHRTPLSDVPDSTGDLDELGGSDTPVRGNFVKEREWVWTIDNDDYDD